MKIDDFLRDRGVFVPDEILIDEKTTQIFLIKFFHNEFPEIKIMPSLYENAVKYTRKKKFIKGKLRWIDTPLTSIAMNESKMLGHSTGESDLWCLFPEKCKKTVVIMELKKPKTKIFKMEYPIVG